MKDNIIVLYQKYSFIVNIVIMSILSFLTTFLKFNFSLNPFVVFVILYSAKIGNYLTILTTIISLCLGSFLKSINYGIEISLVSSLVVFCMALPKFKNRKYSSFFLIFLIYLILSPLYLVASFNYTTIRLVTTSLVVSLILISFIINNSSSLLTNCVLLLLPSILIEINPLFILAIYLTNLWILTNEDIKIRLSSILVSLIINYVYFMLPLEQIVLLTVALVISSILPNKNYRPYLFTLIICSMTLIKYPTTFYKSIEFYLPIVSLLIFLFCKFDIPIHKAENKEEFDILTRIKNIEEYVSLIEEVSPIPTLDKTNLIENLKIKPCYTCIKKDICEIPNSLQTNLPSNLTLDSKKDILKTCPNGSKIIYRYKIVLEMVNNELKENLVIEERHNALKGIITPLKTLCEPRLITVDENTLNNYLQENIIYSYKYNELCSYSPITSGQIKMIEEYLKKKISITYRFDYINHLYYYQFLKDMKNHFVLDHATKGFTKNNGDSYSSYYKDGYFEFFLIDAMGHFESASKYSYLAKRILELARTHEKNIDEKLIELNNILLYQKSNENYVTLDYFVYDLNLQKILLYKFGSSSSFLFHENKVIELENKSLPLGIVPFKNKDPIIIDFYKGDKYCLLTDGLDKVNNSSLASLFSNQKNCKTYLEEYEQKYGLNDDATIALISIE